MLSSMGRRPETPSFGADARDTVEVWFSRPSACPSASRSAPSPSPKGPPVLRYGHHLFAARAARRFADRYLAQLARCTDDPGSVGPAPPEPADRRRLYPPDRKVVTESRDQWRPAGFPYLYRSVMDEDALALSAACFSESLVEAFTVTSTLRRRWLALVSMALAICVIRSRSASR